MAKFSRSVAAYTDVDQILRRVVTNGRLTLTFDKTSDAAKFAARANAYRVLLRNLEREAGRPEISPYDHLMIRKPLTPEGTASCNIVVEPRGFNMVKIVDEDGNEVKLSTKTGTGLDPLPHERTQQELDDAEFLKNYGNLGLGVKNDR